MRHDGHGAGWRGCDLVDGLDETTSGILGGVPAARDERAVLRRLMPLVEELLEGLVLVTVPVHPFPQPRIDAHLDADRLRQRGGGLHGTAERARPHGRRREALNNESCCDPGLRSTGRGKAGIAGLPDLLPMLDDHHPIPHRAHGTGDCRDAPARSAFALAAAAVSRKVIAVDVSEVMLGQLRAKTTSQSISNIEVVNAGFVTYEHAGPPADFVYSRWALHQIPDFWKSVALARMRRALRPGGVLRLSDIVYSFSPDEAEARIEAWCSRLPATAVNEGEWVRSDLEEHVRDEHSTYTWLLEPMIERCGFRLESVIKSSDGFFAEYVASVI